VKWGDFFGYFFLLLLESFGWGEARKTKKRNKFSQQVANITNERTMTSKTYFEHGDGTQRLVREHEDWRKRP
jgi:hypothetical protein